MMLSYRALCNDFYVNQRVALKMDLALRRDTVLSFFDRVRRTFPWMERFRRYPGELSLEARPGLPGESQPHAWIALRRGNVRSGTVNPETNDEALALHRLVLENAPYFLDISPLDIDHVELLYGFDLVAAGNHDAMVFSALLKETPLGRLSQTQGAVVLECQPVLGIALDDACSLQAHVEVKTRSSARQVRTGEYRDEPISVYLTVRKYGPFEDLDSLGTIQAALAERAASLIDGFVAPSVLAPLRESMAGG